jgi:hypothetical protein
VRLWIATSDYRDAATSPLIPISTGVLDDYYIARPRWFPFINGFHFYLIRCCAVCALGLWCWLASYSSVSQLSHTYIYISTQDIGRLTQSLEVPSFLCPLVYVCSSEQCQRIDEYDTPRFVREERGGEGIVCIYWMYIIDRGKESSLFLSTFRCQPTPPMKRTSSEKRKYKM